MDINQIVADLDYDEIFRRGGANCGQEEFDLVKCPHCDCVYLIECEAFTIYLNPDDLDERPELIGLSFDCVSCGGKFPEDAWKGPKATVDLSVTWAVLARSPWNWVAPEAVAAQIKDWPPRSQYVPKEKESPADHARKMGIVSGHGTSFPGYLHESIFLSALQQKRETGSYPAVDKDLLKHLDDAFQSHCINETVQGLKTNIQNWRNKSFTVEDPIKAARIANSKIHSAPEMNFDPEFDDAKEEMVSHIRGIMSWAARAAGVEIVGYVDPLYAWCLNVGIKLIALDVPAENFEQFVSSYVQDLYGCNTMEIVKLAATLPEKLPLDANGSFLAYDYSLLAKLLEELGRTPVGRSRFGAGASVVLIQLAMTMYKISLGRAITSSDDAFIGEIFSLYHGKAVFPNSEQKLDNARFYASMLSSCGRMDEAKRHYEECLGFSQMPEFADQVDAVWSTKFFANRAETELELGNQAKAREYLEAAEKDVSKLGLLLEKNNQSAAEAICLYAHEVMRIEDYVKAEQMFLDARRVFRVSLAPFWGDHATVCLAEIARAKGDLTQPNEATEGAIANLSVILHPSDPYWLIANTYRARMAADQGDVSRAKKFYDNCCNLKCTMSGAMPATQKLLEEFVSFLEKYKLEEDAALVRKRIEALFGETVRD